MPPAPLPSPADSSSCPACEELGARVQRTEARVQRERARRHAAEELVDRHAQRTLRDPLTGLASRTVLVDRLALALEQARRRHGQTGLLLLDLDDFAAINQRLGHDGGDRVLQLVGDRLRGLAGPGDTVARPSGDEFAVLLGRADDAAHLSRLADHVSAVLSQPYVVDGVRVALTPSSGLRLGDGADQAEGVIREAEAALYVAKSGTRGRAVFFESDHSRTADLRRFEAELLRGLAANELVAWFQPVLDLRTGAVVGTEALARWWHPERGSIPPVEFIEQAEEAGLVGLVTDRILDLACTQAAAWNRQDPGRPLLMHVNLSGHDLASKDLVDRVTCALARAELSPSLLCLEITERAMVTDDEVAQRTLRALRDHGVTFAIDDFGVEYASFSYLRRFPVEMLKIDRSFIENVVDDPRDRAVLAGMVAMARSLGMRTVAEGVETADQAEVVRSVGVDEAQGWLFGRPTPPGSHPVQGGERAVDA